MDRWLREGEGRLFTQATLFSYAGPMSAGLIDDYDLTEVLDGDSSAPSMIDDDEILDENAADFLHKLVTKLLLVLDVLCADPDSDRAIAGDHCLYPYEYDFAYRMIESMVLNDGAEITALFARQSGKTETVADVVVTLMVMLPILANRYPTWLKQFRRGVMIGCFAPVDDQAQTLFARIIQKATTDWAVAELLQPDLNVRCEAHGILFEMSNGSFVRRQTAHPRASIESKTYHLIIIDEAQHADAKVVTKSIHPMVASTNGTIVKTGTPDYVKGNFYEAIRQNKRLQVSKKGIRKNHFETAWREVIKYNDMYRRFINKEMQRIGEDSDEFQLSYNLKWLLERGMFTTEEKMKQLGDVGMPLWRDWNKSPLIAGIDVARKQDSTVVTVVWVDWNNPDEFGYYDHRVLNWLEMHGDKWEEQYGQVVDFLKPYSVTKIAVDGQGMGDLFADRISRLLPNVEVQALDSTIPAQSKRWKHLTELMARNKVSWPAHASVRRGRLYTRFYNQMTDVERIYKGGNMLVAAPDKAEAHDDFPDSLALATFLTKEATMPLVETGNNQFFARSR